MMNVNEATTRIDSAIRRRRDNMGAVCPIPLY